METITLDQAQERLSELVRDLAVKGELLITDADRPVAKLSPVNERTSLRNIKPASIGAILQPFPGSDEDVLGEMLEAKL